VEANHYRFESDQAMFVNLNGSPELLELHQRKLQERIAKLTLDLTVVTQAVVEQRKQKSIDKV
jgi:hypothetical protein